MTMRRFDGTAGRRWWHSSSMSRAKIKQSIRHKGIVKCKKRNFVSVITDVLLLKKKIKVSRYLLFLMPNSSKRGGFTATKRHRLSGIITS